MRKSGLGEEINPNQEGCNLRYIDVGGSVRVSNPCEMLMKFFVDGEFVPFFALIPSGFVPIGDLVGGHVVECFLGDGGLFTSC